MRMVKRRAVVVAALVLSPLLAGCVASPWRSALVSVNAAGTGGGNAYSDDPVFSPDGTKVAFNSFASDLGPTDTNGTADVYLRDLGTGTTSLVSANAGETDSGNNFSRLVGFSPDGTKVAFVGRATDLGPVPAYGMQDVFVRDLTTGETSLASVNALGTRGGDGWSGSPVFSPDSRSIAFVSYADDLGPVDGRGGADVYLRDLETGTTTLVSATPSGAAANGGSASPVFSPDGGRIAFTSIATDLGPADGNACDRPDTRAPTRCQDIYLRDLATGATSMVTANAAGTDGGNGWSDDPLFGGDGTSIVFSSAASDLGAADANGTTDIYRRNLLDGTVDLVSADATGTTGGNGRSFEPVLSADGTLVAFTSDATDLGAVDTNGVSDVYLHDLDAGTTSLVSVNADGTDSGDGLSGSNGSPYSTLFFSQDGTKLLFRSLATDLFATDTNETWDLYLRDLATDKTVLVSTSAQRRNSGNGTAGGDFGEELAFSQDGSAVAFTSTATNAVDTDTEATPDILIARTVP